jgi:ArsR family transcriptional regulator
MSPTPLRADPFRLLGEPVRLRILRLLAREPLVVGELVRILGLAQSGVSRHVRLLREGGFVREERDGGWTRLTLDDGGPEGLAAAWPTLRRGFAEAEDEHGDDAGLQVVLRERHERRVGWGASGPEPDPGRSWAAWARALGHLLPPLDVADLGCGAGALALEIARWARRVVAVDPDPAVLARAREAAGERTNVSWTRAELDALPLADASVDLALLSQVLHRLETPRAAVREAERVTRPGGTVLVLDLLPHDESWVTERLGHRRLGIAGEEVGAWLGEAGLESVRWEEAARRRGNPFTVVVASGRKPSEGECA